MIFNLTELNITDKMITRESFNSLYEEFASYDFYLSESKNQKIYENIINMSKVEFIEKLKKYGDYIFYNREEIIYEKVIYKSKKYAASFKIDFQKYIGKSLEEFVSFMNCFYIEENYVKNLAEDVEENLKEIEEELSFKEYLTAYKSELEHMVENYAIKKKI